MKLLTPLLLTLTLMMLLPLMDVSAQALAASLSISPASGSYRVGETFEIRINLDTAGARTSGTDVKLNYDPARLDAVAIAKGSLYPLYVGEQIDTTNGMVRISGLSSSSNQLFSGSGVFATVRFRPRATGTTQLNFDFTPGEKNDCNVADFDNQNDALSSVSRASYTLLAAATPTPSPAPTLTPRPTSTVTPVPTDTPLPTATAVPTQAPSNPGSSAQPDLPDSAAVSMTLLAALAGVTLVGSGGYLLRLLAL